VIQQEKKEILIPHIFDAMEEKLLRCGKQEGEGSVQQGSETQKTRQEGSKMLKYLQSFPLPFLLELKNG